MNGLVLFDYELLLNPFGRCPLEYKGTSIVIRAHGEIPACLQAQIHGPVFVANHFLVQHLLFDLACFSPEHIGGQFYLDCFPAYFPSALWEVAGKRRIKKQKNRLRRDEQKARKR